MPLHSMLLLHLCILSIAASAALPSPVAMVQWEGSVGVWRSPHQKALRAEAAGRPCCWGKAGLLLSRSSCCVGPSPLVETMLKTLLELRGKSFMGICVCASWWKGGIIWGAKRAQTSLGVLQLLRSVKATQELVNISYFFWRLQLMIWNTIRMR